MFATQSCSGGSATAGATKAMECKVSRLSSNLGIFRLAAQRKMRKPYPFFRMRRLAYDSNKCAAWKNMTWSGIVNSVAINAVNPTNKYLSSVDTSANLSSVNIKKYATTQRMTPLQIMLKKYLTNRFSWEQTKFITTAPTIPKNPKTQQDRSVMSKDGFVYDNQVRRNSVRIPVRIFAAFLFLLRIVTFL